MSDTCFVVNFPTEIKTKEDLNKHLLKTKNMFLYDNKTMSKREVFRLVYKDLKSLSKKECIKTISEFDSVDRLLLNEIEDKKLGDYCNKTWASQTNNVFKRKYYLTKQHIKFLYIKNKYNNLLENANCYKLISGNEATDFVFKEVLKEFIIKKGEL